eukprot:m.271436 g.271436  ORF g.271436 m.271436 type:complete len:952 (-) comp16091_c0_seq1:156-3011(-)
MVLSRLTRAVLTAAGLVGLAAAWVPFPSPAVPGYHMVPKSDVPFASLRSVCPTDNSCNLSAVAAACTAEPECRAFNSNGSLKQRADCGWGSEHCVYPQGQPFAAADATDLYIKQGAPPPAEWADAVADGSLLYAQPEPNICEMPEVGNGYVASVVSFASTHVSGLYYGHCGNTHKARLPSPIAGISVANAVPVSTQAGLDARNGIYRRRLHLPSGGVVEQTILAHRTRPHVLLTTLERVSGPTTDPDGPVALQLETLYDFQQPTLPSSTGRPANEGAATGDGGACPNPGGRMVKRPDGSSYPYYGTCTTHDSDCGQCYLDGTCRCNSAVHCCQPSDTPPSSKAGSGCAGTFTSSDFSWVASPPTSSGELLHTGTITSPNDDGTSPTVAVAVDHVPLNVTLSAANGSIRFVAVVIASVGLPNGTNVTAAAANEFANLSTVATADLLAEHTVAWADLTAPRIELGGRNSSVGAWQLQTHFWSSYYYLMSTIRSDWGLGGFSPGGLASQNYQGAVFMDQELYMAQGLLLFHPELALSAAQYRIDSAPASARIAKLFGYEGLMYAWTAAAGGNPFGCCSGKGGFEDCIEQHITPDVAFFLQQIFRATGDVEWLEKEAWPVIQGIAEWVASRVVAGTGGAYHLRGVMPIDEWCDQASGCANPGVDDDPQMNGMCIAALRWAIEAAELIGKGPTPNTWGKIAAGLVLPYNASLGGGVHTMPVGANGISVINPPRATSCPEDINYLSYPLGPSLNISAELTRRDMVYWSDGTKTCLENAGMTAPIHAISWLKTVPPNITGAEFALNRSILAVSYGPFNMRNEVDVHQTTVGGHFNNTHFLTGDGGYMQILLNGFGGLMLAGQNGMQVNQPVVPAGADSLTIVGMHYLGDTLNYTTDGVTMEWAAAGPQALCLFAPPSGTGHGTRLSDMKQSFGVSAFFSGYQPNDAHGRLGPCETTQT